MLLNGVTPAEAEGPACHLGARTTIIGSGARKLMLMGNGRSRIFDVQGGLLALSGLTIMGGWAARGGGLRNAGGVVTLRDVTLQNNSASDLGGGLFNAGTAMLTNVTVTGNNARAGGGIANFGALKLNRVAIRNNSALIGPNPFRGRPAMGIARSRPAGPQAPTPSATPDRTARRWGID
jgi:hypothetical protein